MLSVRGILEVALYVDDLDRSVEFYISVFGFQVLDSSPRIGVLQVADQQLLLLMKRGASVSPRVVPGGIRPPSDATGQQHLAFAIETSDMEAWGQRLAQHGVPVESKVRNELGGHSFYFRDPDQHVIELATPGTWTIY